MGLSVVTPARASEPPPYPAIAAMNLTAQQQQKLTDLGNKSHGQAKQLYEQIHKLRDKLSDLYGEYAFDAAEARRLNSELNRVQGQLLDLHLSEQQQLRGILTSEQFTQLQSALRLHGGWGKHAHDSPSAGHAVPDTTDHAGGH
jgi:Spy/CpxP family protein refolding chaperone